MRGLKKKEGKSSFTSRGHRTILPYEWDDQIKYFFFLFFYVLSAEQQN